MRKIIKIKRYYFFLVSFTFFSFCIMNCEMPTRPGTEKGTLTISGYVNKGSNNEPVASAYISVYEKCERSDGRLLTRSRNYASANSDGFYSCSITKSTSCNGRRLKVHVTDGHTWAEKTVAASNQTLNLQLPGPYVYD